MLWEVPTLWSVFFNFCVVYISINPDSFRINVYGILDTGCYEVNV